VTVPFILRDSEAVGDHSFNVHGVDAEANWIDPLAESYVQLRTQCSAPVEDVSLDGIDVVNTDAIRARLRQACVPRRRGGPFDIVRADFGEVVAYAVLEQEYGSTLGYKGVRDRELVALPGRGIDAIGVEDGPRLTLVLAETKVSDEDRTPPRVVDATDDSLREQHRGHMADLITTANKVFEWGRRAGEADLQAKFFRAALLLERQRWD
jgi:hypothetical protein